MTASLLIRPPAAPPAQAATTRRTILQSLDRVDEYPMFSETTIWAMAMVNNPNVSLAEVANLIRRDAVVAAAVLQKANDWTVGGRRVIDSVHQAVLRVGLQECAKLLCTMGVRAMYERHPVAVQERCDEVHRHSLFVAQLATEINRAVGAGLGGVEFTAGLLHDIGRVILYVKCPPDVTDAAPTSVQGLGILELERSRFGIDHCAVGEHFAERNNLPEQLRRVILNHHRPAEESSQRELVALVAVANRIANHAQCQHNIVGYRPASCPVFATFARGWSGTRTDAFTRSLPGIVVRAIKNTRVLLKSFD
jgi:putative nucleotidyltransferase with HDIG domain